MSAEVNVLAMIKGDDRYVFLYTDDQSRDALRMLGRFAADPELNFTWYDAAVLSKKVREVARAVEVAQQPYRSQATRPRFNASS